MLNDEQILLKTAQLLENLDVSAPKVADLYEFNEKVLREVTEDEMKVMEDVLEDLDPANLPLNDLFSGKMRVVIPFPTINTATELGKFKKFLDDNEYKVDWEKGMVSAVRDVRSDVEVVDAAMGGSNKKKVKKFQMKIGKLFMKIAVLADQKGEILTNDPEFEKNKDFKRINQQIKLYAPNTIGLFSPGEGLSEFASKYFKYWKDNAGYIKKNINKLKDDKFSIIITRHPVDVLRMSDFDEITSCHSPPSRAQAYQSYYKCAVAEAQGHGAVAYVVETEELLYATNTGNIDSAEQEIQEGEIFGDNERFGYDGPDLQPVSRARIRHVRYYDTDEPKRYDEGQDIGMPEKRIYGAAIPGLLDRIVDWARQNQEEAIQNMPKSGTPNLIDLSKFMIFGGSYEDTAGTKGREELIDMLVGSKKMGFTGYMKQNTDTENKLDLNLLGDTVGQYEAQCQEVVDPINQRAAVTTISFDVDQDGAEGVYIKGRAIVKIEWDVTDWNRLPTADERVVQYSPDAINDIYGDLFTHRTYMGRQGATIFWTCHVNLDHPELGGGSYFVLPEEFEETCRKIDSIIDDRHDAWKEILSTYFKREGQMSGGEYMTLAMDIENDELSPYEWQLQSDGGGFEDSYESYAYVDFTYDLEDLNIDPRVLSQILNSREYRIRLRSNLLASARREIETEYYLDISLFNVNEQGRVAIQFKIDADDDTERIELFRELVDGEMDDEDELAAVFNKTLVQIELDLTRGQQTNDINEQLVKNWRRFLV